MFKIKRLRGYLLGALVACMSVPAWSETVVLDLMVLYDDTTAQRFGGQPDTLIHSWVNQVNEMYKNSGVNAQLRLVHTARHNPSGATMSTVLNNVTRDSSIRALRNQYGADFVAQIHRTGNCGVGWMATGRNGVLSNQASEWAYTVSGPRCGAIVLAHELGHNMGLAHSRAQGDQSGGVFHHGLGHGVRGVFASVMAYPQTFNAPHVALFSNPEVDCRGLPCGVPIGRSDAAHAVSAINAVRDQLADFRPTRVPVDDDDEGGDDPVPHSCPEGMTTYNGVLSQAGEMNYHPDNYFFASFLRTQKIQVFAPQNAVFDAILLRWNGRAWSAVASTDSRSGEPLTYSGSTGLYNIGVRATQGTGEYTLCHSR